MRRWLFIGCFILPIPFAQGQQQRVIDSLQLVLDKTPAGHQRIDVLNQLAYDCYDLDDSLGLWYATRAFQESKEHQYPSGLKYSQMLMGIGHLSFGRFNEAIHWFKEANRVQTGEKGRDIYNLTLLGNVYREQAKFDSAIYYYSLAKNSFDGASNADKAVLYKNLGYVYVKLWQNRKAIAYLDSAASLASQDDIALILDVSANYGRAYLNLQNTEKASTYFDKECVLAERHGDYFHRIKCYLNRSQSAYRLGDFPRALQHSLQALQLLEGYKYPPQQVEVLMRISEVYTELSEYAISTRYLLQALKLAEKSGLRYEIAYIYGELAWINKDQGHYQLALDYLQQSQAIRESIGDRYGVAICHNVRGLVYLIQRKYQQSIEEHVTARKIRTEIGHTSGIAASIFNTSLVYQELKQYDRALQLQRDAISIEEMLDDKQSLAISYNTFASLLITTGNLKEAEVYLSRCEAMASQTKSKLLLRSNAAQFANFYEQKGEYKLALKYRKRYELLNDSIYSESAAGKLAEMQALYQLDKKEREIELLSKESELQESQLEIQRVSLRQQRIVIVAAAVILIVVSVYSFLIYRYYLRVKKLNKEISEQNEEIQTQSEELTEANTTLLRLNEQITEKNEEIQAQSEELIEANQTISEVNRSLENRIEERTSQLRQAFKELDTFFYRASHDFRRPLTTFMGLAEVAKITVKDTNALELFSRVNDTAHYLDKMLVKLQSISDVGGQELVYKEIFFKEIFDSVCDTYRDLLKERNIRTTFESTLHSPYVSYPVLVKIILENLIENSIFFGARLDPFIHVQVSSGDGGLTLTVEDNGEGIASEFQDRIFEMYFRANERSKGNGLGLYIVKKAVEKLGGDITIESQLHKGTTVRIVLPETPTTQLHS